MEKDFEKYGNKNRIKFFLVNKIKNKYLFWKENYKIC